MRYFNARSAMTSVCSVVLRDNAIFLCLRKGRTMPTVLLLGLVYAERVFVAEIIDNLSEALD